MNFIIGYGAAIIIAMLAYHYRALNRSGAACAIVVGGTIFALGGNTAAILLLFFFISGSLLSRLQAKNSGRRNWKQVMANGLIPTLSVMLLTLRPDLRPQATLMFLGSLATATADTWATEIGTRFGTTTFNVLSFEPIKKGLSGGVTIIGIIASLLGAFLFALLSLLIKFEPFGGLCELLFTPVLFVIPLAGFCGALVDSIIGAAFQAKFVLLSGEIVEEKPHTSYELARGIRWLGNNATNLIATAIGALIAVGIANWFE